MSGVVFDAADVVAVVGMAGRFPGASSVDEYWQNLLAGKDCITRRPADTADAGGIVFACGLLDDAAGFDAGFFGFSPGEALLLDPQQRVLLECAYHALEDAGFDPKAVPASVGVYAGARESTYVETLLARRDELDLASEYQIRLGSGMDFVTTRISHRLGLTGPAVTVQTACSTSLVAIHTAAGALLAGDCDVALAGGVSVQLDQRDSGQAAAGVRARDGYCRPFDAAAGGTVMGRGAGLVVLRRLDEAISDGQTIHAVLRGTGISNDGSDRLGFTAPSVQGQVRTIRAALAAAQVEPGSIGYIEAHGTGTALGDPIEVAALNIAYAGNTPRSSPCYLGSAKSAIGHLDAAAGVAGFIKAVLAVRDGKIPPTLHFQSANPEIDLAQVPFEVNTETRVWCTENQLRRAAVSSFGLGGTNAHAVVEQPPALSRSADLAARPRHELLVLSAQTSKALDAASEQLANKVTAIEPDGIADVAYTLHKGRQPMPVRRAAVASTARAAADQLRTPRASRATSEPPEVFFLFPGHGSQYPGMASGLDQCEPAFADALNTCAGPVAHATGGADLAELLTTPTLSEDLVAGQLATFCIEWATAAVWRSWGVHPVGVLGHSLGGIVAACVAGALVLDDAIHFVAARARLLASLAPGAMLAVSVSTDELNSLLPEVLLPHLSVAVVNGPRNCVLAGSRPTVYAAAAWLHEHGTDAKVLRVPAAGHSYAVEPILDDLRAAARKLSLRAPAVPWISETTGTTVDNSSATDPERWVAHARQIVRFDKAIGAVLDRPGIVLLEVGPGGVLGALTRQHPSYDGRLVCSSLPHASDTTPAHAHLLKAAGSLWCAGVDIHGLNRRGRRVPLPGYPFERAHYAPDITSNTPASTVTEKPSPRLTPAVDGDPADTAVATAFAKALGVQDLCDDDDFFDLGGDSLIASQLVAVLKAEWGIDIAAKTLFSARTVAALTDVVRRAVHERDNT